MCMSLHSAGYAVSLKYCQSYHSKTIKMGGIDLTRYLLIML